ncbi:MAG: RNA-binding protein [Candidatus Electrothrix sp. AW2]|jgi:spoIIIJ-associated protein|nr:RNA-binding protein [Candidatus Electrothrix gigas]
MVKGKDFYGSTVTDAIAEACQEFSTSQDALNIDILETGSSGIFGLCRKKAHIRVAKKVEKESPEQKIEREKAPQKTAHKGNKGSGNRRQDGKKSLQKTAQKSVQGTEVHQTSQASQATPELPADEVLAEIQEDISTMLDLMGFPSTVTVTLKKYTVACHISDEYEEELVGREGRTLDSLQYLLRKITSRRLPDRIMLSLDVGTYRERRAEELKELALNLASQVREDGKTQAIPALNPSERRVVHMVLQEDKTIRSRSVGAGLFKKILIYKPGKKRPSSRKGKRTGKKGQQTPPASNGSASNGSNGS